MFLLWKTVITFSKIPTLGKMLVTVYNTKFTSLKTIYARLLLPLLFSLKHMACHVFTNEISDLNKCLSHNFSAVCPNWVTLVYLNKCKKFDKQLSSVRPHLLRRTKRRKLQKLQRFSRYSQTQNNHCKAFCVTRKRKNLNDIIKINIWSCDEETFPKRLYTIIDRYSKIKLIIFLFIRQTKITLFIYLLVKGDKIQGLIIVDMYVKSSH